MRDLRDYSFQSPWWFAREAGRDYLTPEDIGEAREAGCPDETIRIAVLVAIEARSAEDVTLCAFVALKPLLT